jgi:DNA topoisomerase-1
MWILDLITNNPKLLNFNLIGAGVSDKPQWTVLRHNGPMFPPEYEPHKIPVFINGKEVTLPSQAEEYATMFARYLGTDYMESTTFKKNFWKDFKPTLGNVQVSSLDEIDFSPIKKYLDREKEKKAEMSKEQKEALKEKQQEIDEPYKNCVIDGGQQKVGNFKIEPPGIFIGRGSHPKLGRIKKRVKPEDVIINLDKEASIPKPNVPGNWGGVIHERTVIWLATWKEEITGKNKYVFTSLDSFFKSKSDEEKFDLARQLKRKANSIREKYESDIISDDLKTKQLATALYFIDELALRVGGKKDSKEEADTVGVTSLRVEHITLLDNNTIKMDFLGKDSVRFCRKVSVLSNVYKNLEDFIKNKNKKDDLFELINSSSMNDYLNSFMEGLTAKVWRTYNASLVFQKELDKIKEDKLSEIDPEERLNFLISMFNQANTAVALLCNHQKAVSKGLDDQIDKIDDKIKELKKKKAKYQEKKDTEKANKLETKIKLYRLKKDTKLKMKNVSLSTSKNNYIDPRIIFAFINKFNIPAERLFTQQLIDRFKWAANVDKDYRF